MCIASHSKCCMHHMCLVRCIFSGCPWIGDPQQRSHVNYHGLCCQPSTQEPAASHTTTFHPIPIRAPPHPAPAASPSPSPSHPIQPMLTRPNPIHPTPSQPSPSHPIAQPNLHLQCLKSHSMGLACNRGHRSRYTQRNVGNHDMYKFISLLIPIDP